MTIRTMPFYPYEPDDPAEKRHGFTRASLFEALDARFEFGDETTRQFFHSAYWRTVLPKIREPEGELTRRWMTPGYGTKYHRAYPVRLRHVSRRPEHGLRWNDVAMVDAVRDFRPASAR